MVLTMGSPLAQVGGHTVGLGAAPVVRGSTALAPLDVFLWLTGAQVRQGAVSGQILVKAPGAQVSFTLGKTAWALNGSPEHAGAAPFADHGVTMVPLEAVARAFGISVRQGATRGQVVLAQRAASGPSSWATSTFSGSKGLPAANVPPQSFSVPGTSCSVSLSEFLSSGNETWDWPMAVQASLSAPASVGQAVPGNLALVPEAPSSGTSFQISGGVGVHATVNCPWGSFSAGKTLGFANSTTAAAPLAGQGVDVADQGCPGFSFAVPDTGIGVDVGICPVVELSGANVGAVLSATGAQTSPGTPASVWLGTNRFPFTATPRSTKWSLGLSGLSYTPDASAGIDVTVTYNLAGASGTLYESPTLWFDQDVAQDAGSGSPASLSFPIGAKVASSMSLTATSPLVVGKRATVSATLSPSSIGDGTVSFTANGSAIGTCTPSAGRCAVAWAPTGAGAWYLGASWGGDATYSGSSAQISSTAYPPGPVLTATPLHRRLGWVWVCWNTPYGRYCGWQYKGNTTSVYVSLSHLGKPVRGATVSFSVKPGGGHFSPATCPTGQGGSCSVSFVASKAKSASYTIMASTAKATAKLQISYSASK